MSFPTRRAFCEAITSGAMALSHSGGGRSVSRSVPNLGCRFPDWDEGAEVHGPDAGGGGDRRRRVPRSATGIATVEMLSIILLVSVSSFSYQSQSLNTLFVPLWIWAEEYLPVTRKLPLNKLISATETERMASLWVSVLLGEQAVDPRYAPRPWRISE